MKKNLLVLAAASVFALTGCHGTKKVGFNEFKEKADAAVEKAPKVDYCTYKGKYGDNKFNFSTNQDATSYSLDEAAVASLLGGIDRVDSMYAYALGSSAEFYVGFGFKVVNGDDKYEYTAKGFLASAKGKFNGKEYSFSISHKFVK